MIRWVFFDVGNVLFNDTPQDFEAFRHFHRAIRSRDVDCSFERVLAEREALASLGTPKILGTLASRWLSPDAIKEVYLQAREFLFSRYDEHNLINDGALEVLASLRKDYHLGIIANQPPQCRPSLVRRGLADLFDVVAISEEIDLHKPDPRIFQWAIDRAGVSPHECVMVGDRHDNDIAPASRLRMRTVWLNWPSHRVKNWFPTDPEAVAFLESTDRVPYYGSVPVEGIAADATVNGLKDIPPAVYAIAESFQA